MGLASQQHCKQTAIVKWLDRDERARTKRQTEIKILKFQQLHRWPSNRPSAISRLVACIRSSVRVFMSFVVFFFLLLFSLEATNVRPCCCYRCKTFNIVFPQNSGIQQNHKRDVCSFSSSHAHFSTAGFSEMWAFKWHAHVNRWLDLRSESHWHPATCCLDIFANWFRSEWQRVDESSNAVIKHLSLILSAPTAAKPARRRRSGKTSYFYSFLGQSFLIGVFVARTQPQSSKYGDLWSCSPFELCEFGYLWWRSACMQSVFVEAVSGRGRIHQETALLIDSKVK